jgi:hypothetical protein
MNQNFIIEPKVDETQEFIEIANDFSNPLDLVREAISNSYDAKATKIWISFSTIKEYGESILEIRLRDNGTGMNKEGLQNFFDLGNSTRREDPLSIGEKGHGTKVYFNSKKIVLKTQEDKIEYEAIMEEPFKKLHNREIPTVSVSSKKKDDDTDSFTEIIIYGYNNNRRDKFTHDILKDYILWFTKHGSIENQFKNDDNIVLHLKGLDKLIEEKIPKGHIFPRESDSIEQLFERYLTKAPDYYSKKVIKEGALKNYPEIRYQAIFAIEGKYVKYDNNSMLRRPGYRAPEGAYTIQERYGLWLCKDFIPIQRKNEWITSKGSEYTRFHAFFNCQDLRLTANRGSIENTPSEILNDIKNEVKRIYNELLSSDDWTSMEWLEDEATAHQTKEKEIKNFEWRIKKVNRSNIAQLDNITLIEPERESGVYSLFLILSTIKNELFPFQIIDYDTHEGIDVIAKGDKKTPIINSKLYYVEFKRTLSKGFNHSFENLHSVVCWETDIKHDDILEDINGEQRKMEIASPENEDDYTTYFLTHHKKAHRIEVFVLKHFLKEKLNLEFKPRTSKSLV